MTTKNNHLTLIEQIGIEKAKAIVVGAPESNFPVKWGLSFKTYFRQVGYFVEQWFESKWQTRYSDSDWVDLETISTAIAEHDNREFKVGDWVVVITNALGNKFTWEVVGLDGCMIEISQIGQPNEWVHYAEIAHATPLEIKAGRRLDDTTDHVTDIRNHISPSTKVVEL